MEPAEDKRQSQPAAGQKDGAATGGQTLQAKKGRRYRLMFFNERKNRVVFSFSMPTSVAALLLVFVLALTAALVVIIMTRTPLKSYLPGYLDVEKRAVIVETALRLDSLERESRLRSIYLQNLTDILSGRIQGDSIVSYDSAVVVMFNDSLQAKSPREEAFVARFEEAERYSLNALVAGTPALGAVFMVPVKGEVIESGSGQERSDWFAEFIPEVVLRVRPETPVLAPLDGTVISVDFDFGGGYTLILQHANDYISVFSNLKLPLVSVGKVVKSGTVIGQAGAEEGAYSRMWLRIWHRGRPIDPCDVIPF